MSSRHFSEAVKFNAVKLNLEKNHGEIHCEICKKQIFSIRECNLDHIISFAKGGKSTLDNCQILCVACNLSKYNKEQEEMLMEEKARRFFNGEPIDGDISQLAIITEKNKSDNMTKEKFDSIVGDYIKENGDIRQIDFSREKNHLPGISYMIKYYGTLNELKKAFGITDISLNWNRENIADALRNFVSANGKITQKDIRKENGLPSINCILNYYPEYRNFTEIKQGICDLDVRGVWTKDEALAAGKLFVREHDGKLTQKDCKSDNGLPQASVIYRLFGDMPTYQKAVGAAVSKNNFVSKQEIEKAVEEYFDGKERIVESRAVFFKSFPYGLEAVCGRYGSFNKFAEQFDITVIKSKKGKYTKQEVDKIISDYIDSGKPIPRHQDLKNEGLPCANVIMRYYDHWRQPFEIFRLYNKMKAGS